MKNDQMMLAGAVLLAGFLVAKKTGMFNKVISAGPSVLSDFRRMATPFTSGDPTGYDPANPGAYVPVDGLMAGATENDFAYLPTFSQTVDAVLGLTPPTSVIRVRTPW